MNSTLVDRLHDALIDEVYDGASGALTDDQLTAMVRKLAETAATVVVQPSMTDERLIADVTQAIRDADNAFEHEVGSSPEAEDRRWLGLMARAAVSVFEKAHTPALTYESDWEQPETVIERILDDAGYGVLEPWRADVVRAISDWAAGFRRSEVPEPSGLDGLARRWRGETQGEPSAPEVLGEWFTSSHGVAVAAMAPMTDRGPAVMVDGRVISPNDVAALVEFKAQGEPSDAQTATIAAEALEQAVFDFEHDMGIREFDEATSTDGRHWEGIADAWEYQGPFMEWLRGRARALRAASEAGGEGR